MKGFTDIHAHVIYGVDDGARTRADMEAMLEAAHADGITSLFATPHITPGVWAFDFAAYGHRLEEARSYCQKWGDAMTIYAGAEIMYTPALQNYVVEYRLPALAGAEHVLMEFSPDIALRDLESALELMERHGYVTVLAHIERYACLFHGNIAGRLKARHDVRYQVNANTVLSVDGFWRRRRIQSWFRNEWVDFVASDAHDVRKRPFQMKKAYAALKQRYGQEYAQRLMGMR